MSVDRRTRVTRWVGALAAFVVVGLVAAKAGHSAALVLMIALLLVVAIFGGSGYDRSSDG